MGKPQSHGSEPPFLPIQKLGAAFTARPSTLLENTSECPVLVIAEPEPDTAFTDLQTKFKPVAIPVVDQTIAPPDHFANCGRFFEGEFPGKLLPGFGPECTMPPRAIAKIQVDEVLVCAEAAPLCAW